MTSANPDKQTFERFALNVLGTVFPDITYSVHKKMVEVFWERKWWNDPRWKAEKKENPLESRIVALEVFLKDIRASAEMWYNGSRDDRALAAALLVGREDAKHWFGQRLQGELIGEFRRRARGIDSTLEPDDMVNEFFIDLCEQKLAYITFFAEGRESLERWLFGRLRNFLKKDFNRLNRLKFDMGHSKIYNPRSKRRDRATDSLESAHNPSNESLSDWCVIPFPNSDLSPGECPTAHKEVFADETIRRVARGLERVPLQKQWLAKLCFIAKVKRVCTTSSVRDLYHMMGGTLTLEEFAVWEPRTAGKRTTIGDVLDALEHYFQTEYAKEPPSRFWANLFGITESHWDTRSYQIRKLIDPLLDQLLVGGGFAL